MDRIIDTAPAESRIVVRPGMMVFYKLAPVFSGLDTVTRYDAIPVLTGRPV